MKPLLAASTSAPPREEELVGARPGGEPVRVRGAVPARTGNRSRAMCGRGFGTRAAPRTSSRKSSFPRTTAWRRSATGAPSALGSTRSRSNACLDEARRRSRTDALILGWDEFPPPDERIVVHHPSPDDQLWQKEELAELTEAIDELPQSQHDALVMRELEGRSYEEIGQRMSLSPAAVESVLFRARRGVKRAFDRAAAFLPFPALFGRRGESGEQASGASSFAAQAQGTAAQLTAVGGDHAASVVQKAAAVVAAVAVVGGGTAALEQAGVKVPIVNSITAKKDDDSKAAGTAGPGAASFGGAGGAGRDRAGGPGGSGPPGGAQRSDGPGRQRSRIRTGARVSRVAGAGDRRWSWRA